MAFRTDRRRPPGGSPRSGARPSERGRPGGSRSVRRRDLELYVMPALERATSTTTGRVASRRHPTGIPTSARRISTVSTSVRGSTAKGYRTARSPLSCSQTSSSAVTHSPTPRGSTRRGIPTTRRRDRQRRRVVGRPVTRTGCTEEEPSFHSQGRTGQSPLRFGPARFRCRPWPSRSQMSSR